MIVLQGLPLNKTIAVIRRGSVRVVAIVIVAGGAIVIVVTSSWRGIGSRSCWWIGSFAPFNWTCCCCCCCCPGRPIVGWGCWVIRGGRVVGTSIVVGVDFVLVVLRDYVVLRQVDCVDGAAEPSVCLHLLDVVITVHSLSLPFTIQKHPITWGGNLSKKNKVLL